MAASTGSPASRRSTKLTPLTTRPSLTSRQGITRTLNMQNSSIMIRSDQSDHDLIFLFEHDLRANAFRVCRQRKPVAPFPDHALGRRPRVTDQRQCRRSIEPAIIEGAARDRSGEFFRTRRQQRLYIVDRGKTA